jgi:hypothetical protein
VRAHAGQLANLTAQERFALLICQAEVGDGDRGVLRHALTELGAVLTRWQILWTK